LDRKIRENVDQLQIIFDKNDILAKDKIILSHLLENIPQIEYLKLKFNPKSVTDEEILVLFPIIFSNIQNLGSIDLDFIGSQISNSSSVETK